MEDMAADGAAWREEGTLTVYVTGYAGAYYEEVSVSEAEAETDAYHGALLHSRSYAVTPYGAAVYVRDTAGSGASCETLEALVYSCE